MLGYTFVIKTSFGNQTIISPIVRPTILTILARQGPPGPPGTGFDGNDVTFNFGQGIIYEWPDGIKRRIITLYDEIGNPTLDFEIVL